MKSFINLNLTKLPTMKLRTIARVTPVLVAFMLITSFTNGPAAMKYSPAGTWDYTVPGVQSGYEKGQMIIVEEEDGLGVTIALNEYYKVEGEEVEYAKKELKFAVFLENERIDISGKFKRDEFKGKVSYFEGDFEMNAVRLK